MLQRLRDKAQGWAAWVIIGLIAITFILFGTESLFSSQNGNMKIVAKVNGVKISEKELEDAFKRYIQQTGKFSANNLDQVTIKKELLQSLIEQAAVSESSLKMGMSVTSNRITSFIHGLPIFLDEQGKFSSNAYQQFLLNANYSDSTFRHLLSESLLREQLQEGIIQSSFSSEANVKDLVKFLLQKRDFRFTLVKKESFENQIKVKEEEIKQYYQDHLKNFVSPEEVAIEYVHLSKDELQNQYLPDEKELERFYEENKGLFTQPARIQVAHILVSVPKNANAETRDKAKEKIQDIEKQLQADSSFAELAKKYSDDKGSAEKGGELEPFVAGEMVPEFEKTAFALDKIGQISSIIQTDFGFHLIKLQQKYEEKISPFAEVKSQVKEKLLHEWEQEQFAEISDKLATLAFDFPDTLQPLAQQSGLTIQKTKLFTQEAGPDVPFLQNINVIEAAFHPSVKEEKNNSDLIKLDDNNVIVLRVTDFVPSKQKEFNQVKNEIKAQLISKKAKLAANNKAKNIQVKLANAIADILPSTMQEFVWEEKKDLLRTSKGTDAQILEAAFAMQRPNEKDRILTVVELINGDSAVVWLTKVFDGRMSDLKALEKETYQNALAKHWGELEFTLYTTDLLKKARVEKVS